MTEAGEAEPAASRWARLLGEWGLPQHIVDQAPESPWGHDTRRFEVDDTLDRESTSARWAREVLPPAGGTVLDVGCGGGRSSLTLIPPANELIGVDRSGAMLDAFVEAATRVGVARRTVHGSWPDVSPYTPIAEVTTRHPMSAWSPGLEHFWGLERPAGPTGDDLVAVISELGLDPEHTTSARGPLPAFAADPEQLLPMARRRLCLGPERDDELAAWLVDHPLPWPDRVATIRWPGTA